MENSTYPPEVTNYGASKKAEGYEAGYFRAVLDSRKRKLVRQKSIHLQFGDFFDWLDDVISANRKH